MTTKHLKGKTVKEEAASYQVVSTKDIARDRMSDDDFKKAMAALEDIWDVCPPDAPKDLSINHDRYLYGKKG